MKAWYISSSITPQAKKPVTPSRKIYCLLWTSNSLSQPHHQASRISTTSPPVQQYQKMSTSSHPTHACHPPRDHPDLDYEASTTPTSGLTSHSLTHPGHEHRLCMSRF
ncbi:hypothetical protein M758_5G196300 [Ceratodon purpureus]|uniref:Uncharacterized protein n=1 Tax=Ceratodon purpureus TaxID=3225 RepID=A0A8T0I6M4_CERPU|nr:hypothetical protein KC19_5G202500 [Ceratodon purpureus]KAG0617528.1 hypothetical protein M758_5G196300 [Ceratodon purpureus]